MDAVLAICFSMILWHSFLRLYFNASNSLHVFLDLKFGIAIISEGDSSLQYQPYKFAWKPPIVLGLKTGLIIDLSKKFSLGFGFDNLGIIYKYVYEVDNSTGYDASRISILTTDIIFHFKK